MTEGIAEPIAWAFTDSPGLLQWAWVTDHFVARVSGTEVPNPEDPAGRRIVRSYAWELADLMRRQQGMPRVLVEGTSPSFEDAEMQIREHVGKCYDPRLGYRRFSGALAFTYTLASGERIDIRPYIGTRTTVTVLRPDRTEESVVGDFEQAGYRWRLREGATVLEIVPEHVVRLANRSQTAEQAAAIVRSPSYTGIARIYAEDPRPGCTGRAGFAAATVDHAGAPRCPIHEAGIPEHLLR